MTKIDIFSGFLGAGKTTLIRKLISEAFKGEKLVLIENEFGEIAIDGGFLQDAGIEITEMSQGCICCSLVGDFGKALRQVLETYHPDRILIEPSGVGKLSDVIRAVQNLHMEDVTLNSFTTVADANKCKMYMKNFGEFYNDQIEHANSIILSRTDGIKPEKLEACVALLREHNQNATIITTPWDQLTGAQILETMETSTTITTMTMMSMTSTAPAAATTTMTMMTSTNITTMTMMSMTSTAPAAAMTTITTMMSTITSITTIIMPTRCSQAGAPRRPASSRRTRSSTSSRSSTTAKSTA